MGCVQSTEAAPAPPATALESIAPPATALESMICVLEINQQILGWEMSINEILSHFQLSRCGFRDGSLAIAGTCDRNAVQECVNRLDALRITEFYADLSVSSRARNRLCPEPHFLLNRENFAF